MVEEDEVVASLLLIHDLYPVALEERVVEALDSVRPYMESHGGDVDFLGVEDGVAHLRLRAAAAAARHRRPRWSWRSRRRCRRPRPTWWASRWRASTRSPPTARRTSAARPLPLAGHGARPGNGAVPALSGWQDLDAVASLPDGQMAAHVAGAVELLVANVNGTLLAYLNACAACESPLHEGSLADGILTCPGCSARFDLPRAGRGSEDAAVQLDPVPLLRDGPARVRVAVPA